jgi:class 3 adenylate cyclase
MGLSDPINPLAPPTLADLEADLEAVIRTIGVEEPVLFGMHNGGAVSALYASRHHVKQLVMCNAWARIEFADDYTIGFESPVLDELDERYREQWGQGTISSYWSSHRPSTQNRRLELHSTSRSQAVTLFRMNRAIDIRSVLRQISVPTLVIHSEENRMVPPVFGKFLADSIPGAKLEFVSGHDQIFIRNNPDAVLDLVEPFVTGTRRGFSDRTKTVILFTDIVNSTPRAAALGDEGWSTLMEEHNERLLRAVHEYDGYEIKSTGDGFLVTFEETDAAIRCAMAAIEDVAELGLELRAGVHVGEVAPMGRNDVSGLSIHMAQRLCDRAQGGQVLVSAAAREHGEGSGIRFEERGTTPLKGFEGEWEVFEARL